MTKKIQRPCHLYQMFIRHDGVIFPCCRKWGIEEFAIGNISDTDIINKISKFDIKCACYGYEFKKSENNIRQGSINIEFPMKCNGRCAMCCVSAPYKQNTISTYDYTRLLDFVSKINPRSLVVQGGEVLVQPLTIEWLANIKKQFADLKICIVTNGCVNSRMTGLCDILFEKMIISIVGFQDLTYKAIMGLQLESTKKFAAKIINSTNIVTTLKYLCTPLNIHEIKPFMEWAVSINPYEIQIVDADTINYINLNTKIPFWHQLIERSSHDFLNSLIEHKDQINSNQILISIDNSILNLFKINLLDIQKAGLNPQIWF